MAGTARIDITPDWPVMLAGFGQRTTPSTGVLDPIFAKALYLSDGRDGLLIITSDLSNIAPALGRAVTQALVERTGLTDAQICLCASHTHSAPMPSYAGDDAPGVEAYEPFLRDKMIAVGAAAIAAAKPSRIRTGVGQADIFLNRRTRGNPNRVDRRVAVIALEDAATGQVDAVLFGCGCHPTVLGWDRNQISADFTGHAQARIEAALDGATALFFNTAQGNIVPNISPNFDALDPRGYYGGTAGMVARLGDTLADEVLRVVHASPAGGALQVGCRRTDLVMLQSYAEYDDATAQRLLRDSRSVIAEFLGENFDRPSPPRYLWSVASAAVIERDLPEPEMRRLMIACCAQRALQRRLGGAQAVMPVPVPVQVIRINEFELLALPGEVLVESGEEWSRLADSPTAFILAIANSHFRYLPGACHFAEPNAENRYETASAGLQRDAIDLAFAEAARLLTGLRAEMNTGATR